MDIKSAKGLAQRHPEIRTRQEMMSYVLATLNYFLIKVDGDIDEREKASIVPAVDRSGFVSTSLEIESYKKGTRDVAQKAVKLPEVMGLTGVFETSEEKIKLLKCLIHISSADGTLDKAEYSLIYDIAESLTITIPKFDELAEKLNIDTGNAARKRKFEVAGGVLKTVGKGVAVTAALGISVIGLLIKESSTQPKGNRRQSPKKPTSTRKPIQSQNRNQKRPYRYRSKNCAYCRHWHGDREVDVKNKIVFVALQGQPRGICAASPGGKRIVLASHTCRDFASLL
jgi:uncharacterized tellurite resistance protein B-like protein